MFAGLYLTSSSSTITHSSIKICQSANNLPGKRNEGLIFLSPWLEQSKQNLDYICRGTICINLHTCYVKLNYFLKPSMHNYGIQENCSYIYSHKLCTRNAPSLLTPIEEYSGRRPFTVFLYFPGSETQHLLLYFVPSGSNSRFTAASQEAKFAEHLKFKGSHVLSHTSMHICILWLSVGAWTLTILCSRRHGKTSRTLTTLGKSLVIHFCLCPLVFFLVWNLHQYWWENTPEKVGSSHPLT